MKVFVAGGEGFVGRNVCEMLSSQGHNVLKGTRRNGGDSLVQINLLNQKQVEQRLSEIKPDVIINCAGVIDKNGDFEDNVRMSANLLGSAAVVGLRLHRFVMCGSAGEYGNVAQKDWPVSEETPLRPVNPYAQSKVREEDMVREFASGHDIDAVVARIFNPIGSGMPAKFLISNILGQIEKIKSGENSEVSVGRTDALRDYVDVRDAAKALALLALRDHRYDAYNVGSGRSTSTGELIRCIMRESGVSADISIRELSDEPERPVASQADISRLVEEFGWRPEIPLRKTIRGIISHERHE